MSVSQQDVAELRRLANGYQLSQALHVAAVLGLADLVGDGPRSSDELAEVAGAHPPSLYRLLRALASVGVFREEDGRRFAPTALSDLLRRDSPGSLHGWVEFVGRRAHWDSWACLVDSVRTGESAFRLRHGESVWDYRARDPEENAAFDAAMTAISNADRGLIAAYDFGRFATVVDVGGGRGGFLASLLAAHPDLRGILLDQPHVVAGAPEPLRAAGVAARCELVGGSFFDAVPAGGDIYLLKNVIVDWDDAQATAILRVCRRAMPAAARLLVVQRVLAPGDAPDPATFGDLNMLVMVGGQERTAAEFAALYEAAGFRPPRILPTAAGVSLIEGQLA